jgi:hypothetical protein
LIKKEKMSKKYRYRCASENTLVFETRSSDASPPSLCINEGSAIVAGTLCLIQDDTLESLTFEPTGVIDFNHCTISELSHTSLSDIGNNSHNQIDTHIANSSLHTAINDAAANTTTTWSGSKINTELETKADSSALTNHTGDATIHFTQAEIVHQNISGAGTNNHNQIDSHIAASSAAHGVSGTIVGTTDTQTLSNKTLTATTNNVVAKGIHSATTIVSVSDATAPTSGQVLTATSSTTATWQDVSSSSPTKRLVASFSPLQISTTNSSYERVIAFTYAGSAELGAITEFCIIAYKDAAPTNYQVRCVNLSAASVVLFEGTFTNTTEGIQTITSISNVPTTKSLLEIQVRRVGGGSTTKVYLSGLTVYA